MFNRIVLIGRLTRDPELRRTQSDLAVSSFTIAVDDRFRGSDGQKSTIFLRVSVWGAQAENVKKYTHKGSLVAVDGRIRQRTFQNRDGVNVTSTEVDADNVTFLDPKGAENLESTSEAGYVSDVPSSPNESSADLDDLAEDDLPF